MGPRWARHMRRVQIDRLVVYPEIEVAYGAAPVVGLKDFRLELPIFLQPLGCAQYRSHACRRQDVVVQRGREMSVQQQLRGKPNEPSVVLEKLVDLLWKAALRLDQLFPGNRALPGGQAISAGDIPEVVPAKMSERMFWVENLAGRSEIEEQPFQRHLERLVRRKTWFSGANASEGEEKQQRFVRRTVFLGLQNVDALDSVEKIVVHVSFVPSRPRDLFCIAPVATNGAIRPAHLANLPIFACSWKNGYGCRQSVRFQDPFSGCLGHVHTIIDKDPRKPFTYSGRKSGSCWMERHAHRRTAD